MCDEYYAIAVAVLLLLSYSRSVVFELLLQLTRQGATLLLLGTVFALFYKNFPLTGLVLAVGVVAYMPKLWTTYPRSDDRRLQLEISRDNVRFDPASSIDLQFANGDVVHDTPAMYRKDPAVGPLLVFPPFGKAHDGNVGKLLEFPPTHDIQNELNG
jgi:hypothetical protein